MNDKDLMPIGTNVFDVMRQEWGVLARIGIGGDKEDYRYSVGFADEDDESYKIDGCVLSGHVNPSLSLSFFNYVTGAGKFTPITEWRTYLPKTKYADLYKFFFEEHNLMLFDGQIEYIINEVKKHLEND